MTKSIELFIQGGLGNQLIQMAYADALALTTGAEVEINPILMSRAWSLLRGVSHRARAWDWSRHAPDVKGLPRQASGFLRFKFFSKASLQLQDTESFDQHLHRIEIAKDRARLPLLGYFQRYESLHAKAESFWKRLSKSLYQNYHPEPFPADQIVVHVRLGDYLLPQNKRLFASVSLKRQLKAAMDLRKLRSSSLPVHLVTDDPDLLQEKLDKLPTSRDFSIYRSTSALDDFIFLTRHRHIVGSNSTFSLCAARIARDLWGQNQTIHISPEWYLDKHQNLAMMHELRKCPFVSIYN